MIHRIRSLGPALPVLAAISFVSSLGISIMLPLLPLYGLSLGATPLQLGMLTSAFAIANSVGQFGAGNLIDRFGTRRFILGGTALYAAANALIATASSAVSLIAYRGIAGLGGGTNIIATRLYISQNADPKRLAFFNSILSASTSAGNVFGPAIGGLVAVATDLRIPFVIVAVTSSLAFVGATLLPRTERIVHAPRPAGERVWTRAVIVLFASNLLLLMGFGGWITSYAPFATTHLGWSTFDVGIIFTIFGIGDITLGPWLGHFADRFGRRRMAVMASFPVFFFGIALVLALPRPAVYAVSFVTGASLTAFNASWFALLTTAVPPQRRGRVFGTVNAIGNVGTVIGAMGASVLWQAFDVGYGLVLSSCAVLVGGLVLLVMPREARSSEPVVADAAG